jgi:hypothetical protein
MTFKRSSPSRHWCLCIPLVAILALTACGSDSGDDATSPTPVLATDTFSGSIEQNGAAVHSFTVTSSGYTLLAGYTAISPASVTALGVGIGSWDTSTSSCSLNITQNDTARSGSTAISGTVNSGNYCVRIYDAGNIPAGASASYSVQIQHY